MWMLYVLMGVVAGSVSGLLGIGGGILLVPAFIYILGMSQQLAQGTSIALMVPPISILAAIAYWRQGNVDFTVASWVCLGVVFGSLIGALGASYLEEETLRKLFGVMLLMVSVKMLVF